MHTKKRDAIENRLSVKQHVSRQMLLPGIFVVMWSSGAIFAKLGLEFTGPLTFLALRLILSWVIIGSISLILHPEFPHTIGQWRTILLIGVFLQIGYQSFFFFALAHGVSPGLLTIILGMQPIITSGFSKDHVGVFQWVGLLLGLLGLILVVIASFVIGNISWAGIGSALLSLISITVGTFLQKTVKTDQLASITIQYTGSAVILTVLAMAFEHFIVHWTPAFMLALGWMVFIVSVGATLLLYFMIQRGSLTRVTSLFYSVPAVTALLDYIVFGQRLHQEVIMGMLLIMAGLFIINKYSTISSK